MGHSYSCNFVHLVFSTKERRACILPAMQERLWLYLAGIAQNLKVEIRAIGGTRDHVHMLIALPSAESLSGVIAKLKANSSKWAHEQNSSLSWQEGYGAFSVSASHVNTVCAYIRNQEEHHKKRDFKAEFLELLQRYGVEYDPRYVLG